MDDLKDHEPQVNGGEGERTDASEPQERKGRRGRKPGSTNKPKDSTETFTTDDQPKRRPRKANAAKLARQIEGAHQIIAMLTKNDVLILQPQEADALAEAMANVSNEYGVAVNGKAAASIQLVVTMAMIYGPRVYAINMAKKAARAKDITAETEIVRDQPQPAGGQNSDTSPERAFSNVG